MYHLVKFIIALCFVCCVRPIFSSIDIPSFDEYYNVIWGNEHVIRDHRSIVQLYMDLQKGGAGFESKYSYGSGFFKLRIKLPGKEAAGVVTAYYLTSGNQNNHDELDFEFLGNRAGKPYTLQTNIFLNGVGGREQRLRLWFDPTAHFHSYEVLWNEYHIVFFVDDIPIREFRNNNNYGVSYPTRAMKIEASLWDGDDWATDGGQTKTNWSCAPFRAYFDDFEIDGCSTNGKDTEPCNASNYWWNDKRYMELDSTEIEAFQIVKDKYINYDYCTDKPRYPVPPPECNN